MNIIITGTTGFLGRSLAEYFERDNIVIRHQRDTPASLTSYIKLHKPEVYIHCAGEIYNPALMVPTNILMVNEILEAIREYSPHTRFIQIGSSAEYGPIDHPGTEQDRINPVDVYQATKGAATLLTQAYSRQYGLQTCVARIYSGFGPHERPHRLFPRLFRAFYKGEAMKLYDGYHDFIYVDDFVRGIDLLLKKTWPAGEIVQFGSGIQYSNLEVLRAWENVTGTTGAVEYIDQISKPFESKVWVCDPTYAREAYGFKTEISLERGIKDMIEKLKLR